MSNPIEELPGIGAETTITEGRQRQSKCFCFGQKWCNSTEAQQKYIVGCFIVVCLAITWVASSHLGQETYVQNKFHAPLFCMYFWTAWLVLFYPAYVIIEKVFSKEDFSVRQTFREHIQIYKTYDFRRGEFAGKSILFCVLWGITSYTYIRALDPVFLTPTDASVLFATNHSFVYMLSWIVLFEKFVPLRVVALILSISSIVLFAYADGFGSHSTWGVVLAICSSAAMSIFKVLFKKFIGQIGFGQLSMFLSILGIGNLLTVWPIIILLYHTGTEMITTHIPLGYLFGTALTIIVFQFLSNYTECLSNESITGMGMVLAIPLCLVSDFIWKNRTFNGMKFSAILLSILGLILVLIPDTIPGMCSFCTNYIQNNGKTVPNNDQQHRMKRPRLKP